MLLTTVWRAFEGLLKQRGLGWAVNYAPANLEWDEAPTWASAVEKMLPADYKAFVKEVGYPMVGFGLYCDRAFSFLPPAALRFYAADCFGPGVEGPVDKPLAAFFAAVRDLADISGFAFVDNAVWLTRDAVPDTKLVAFTPWLEQKLAELTSYVTALSDEEIAAFEKEADPHRLIDYSARDDAK